MAKSVDAFRSIGEVASLIGVAPHVLRYWETQFPQLAPVKRADGRRYYRPDDVRLAAGLCEVMREDGMTARGAIKLMAADKGAAVRQRGAERLQALDEAPAAVKLAEPKPRPKRPPTPRARPKSLPLFDAVPPEPAAPVHSESLATSAVAATEAPASPPPLPPDPADPGHDSIHARLDQVSLELAAMPAQRATRLAPLIPDIRSLIATLRR